MKLPLSQQLGCLFLIAGTAMGAGMLALPLQIANTGCWPGMVGLVITWGVMAASAWMWWNVSRHFDPNIQLTRLTKVLLGPRLASFTGLIYLGLLVCLCSAYLSALGQLVQTALSWLGWPISDTLGACLVAMITSLILVRDFQKSDATNRMFGVVMMLAFLALIYSLFPHLQAARLQHQHWQQVPHLLPIIITAFGFHIVIPTLRQYTHDHPQLGRIIILGSLIPLVCYLAWTGVLLGGLPYHGPLGLQALEQHARPSVELGMALSQQNHSPWIPWLMNLFSMSAITTSFIGVSRSLFDSLKDQWHHRSISPAWIGMLTLAPPLVFIAWQPRIFQVALEYAGLLVSYLLIMVPSILYIRQHTRPTILPWPCLAFGAWVILNHLLHSLA